jgi:hypothetical protein
MPVSGRPVADGRHKLRDEQTHRLSYSTLGVLKTTEVAYLIHPSMGHRHRAWQVRDPQAARERRARVPTRPSHPP